MKIGKGMIAVLSALGCGLLALAIELDFQRARRIGRAEGWDRGYDAGHEDGVDAERWRAFRERAAEREVPKEPAPVTEPAAQGVGAPS